MTKRSAQPVTLGDALRVSLGISLLFLLLYFGSNWLASHRTHVRSANFAWERRIPFVPLMLIPYMSIDLFFVAAPFLCRDREELTILRRRLLTALLVGVGCFLLLPLRFAFPRPPVPGWLGSVYEWFRSLDQPYNQLPSLHIAFGVVLIDVYARRTRGTLRALVVLWFFLIAASAVLSYQHHVVDVLAGLLLGGYCIYFIPKRLSASAARRESSSYSSSG